MRINEYQNTHPTNQLVYKQRAKGPYQLWWQSIGNTTVDKGWYMDKLNGTKICGVVLVVFVQAQKSGLWVCLGNGVWKFGQLDKEALLIIRKLITR
jgi:hypothetical protein